jgi:hypothetical protein
LKLKSAINANLFRFGFVLTTKYQTTEVFDKPPGDISEVVPPVPIPNTEVKRLSADDTEGAGPCGKYVIARRLFLFLFCFDV